MDYLWSPWRYRYMAEAAANPEAGCIFCMALKASNDKEVGIVLRGSLAFVILNKFPYTTGHVMVVPNAHVGELANCDDASLSEIMNLTKRTQVALGEIYHPQGYNLGMNLGRAAGAGVVGHLHMHLLPRWIGDSNFMTVVGETRVQPEDLSTTYEKLHRVLRQT